MWFSMGFPAPSPPARPALFLRLPSWLWSGAAALLCLPAVAQAAPRGQVSGVAEVSRRPRNSIELSLSPYRPAVSHTPEVEAARSLIFDAGHNWLGRHPLQYGLLYGRYLSQRCGLLGVYGRASYWTQQAPARLCMDGNDVVPCTVTTVFSSSIGADGTSLNVVPVGVGALWRIDQLREALDWPLTFALKVGIDYHFWWASVGDSIEKLSDGARARGGNWGLSGAAQVAFALDSLKKRHPRYGSKRGGMPAYLYAEYRLTWAPGLLQPGPRIDLSDCSGFALGLALELP